MFSWILLCLIMQNYFIGYFLCACLGNLFVIYSDAFTHLAKIIILQNALYEKKESKRGMQCFHSFSPVIDMMGIIADFFRVKDYHFIN